MRATCSTRFAEPWVVPMATEVKLPRLGQGMESGTIVKWLKSEGDKVEKGEPLYEVDTDKATQEVEAESSGVLLKIAVAEGEVPVGRTVAVIGEEGEEPQIEEGEVAEEVEQDEQEEGSPGEEREEERERSRQASKEETLEVREPTTNGGRVKASPLARRIARERGIDLAALAGTGPEGRVVAEDVERASTGTGATARRLTEAWQAPAFQITMSADMERALELHARLAESAEEGGPKVTVTDVLTKACAAALMRHRAVNALFAEDSIELHPSANIGIAVAIPAGLVVPVIPQAERL